MSPGDTAQQTVLWGALAAHLMTRAMPYEGIVLLPTHRAAFLAWVWERLVQRSAESSTEVTATATETLAHALSGAIARGVLDSESYAAFLHDLPGALREKVRVAITGLGQKTA